jgi:protein-S-isoprenylcysteine O-methyltransferase Ste14
LITIPSRKHERKELEGSMYLDEPRARIGYRTSALSRAKQIAVKALIVLGGVLMLASAFVVSLVFLAVGLAIVLVAGVYLWWQTRELRKQMRARMQAHSQPQADSRVIEGEVLSDERTRR